MDINGVERIVITKPIASKPSFSKFRSFSELLAGAINASPSPANVCSETAIAAIRPKTVRVKPIVNRASIATQSSQGEVSGTAPASKLPQYKSSVLYKPLAKVVSKATVSLLASMFVFEQGTPSVTHQQALAQVEARAQHLNQSKLHATSKPIAYGNMSVAPMQAEKVQLAAEPPKRASEKVEEPKAFTACAVVDRPSYDGYNWRKYGQKQVKGSEYPRSYYKCTHPNCPVKKKVERSFDGQIAEIVYKGEHNHPKPQPPKKSSSGTQGQGLGSEGTTHEQDTNNPKSSNSISEQNEVSEGRVEKSRVEGVVSPTPSTYLKKSRLLSECHDIAGAYNIACGAPDDSCVHSGECEEGSKGVEVDDSEPRSKRRKSGDLYIEQGTSGEGIQEPRISVQNAPEVGIVGDGFRWRKYGQKVVKGNPYPRSYYKCTSIKCNVRKHVERVSDESSAFITTYEGKHNHDMPVRANSAASQSDTQAPSDKKSSPAGYTSTRSRS